MIRTVLTVTAVVIVGAAMWAARAALMLIYVSAIIAMGFSPMVRFADRPRRVGGEKRVRVRRTLAILTIYLAIIALFVAVAMTVVPPLADQAGQLWDRLPKLFRDFQDFLRRHRLMTQRVTLEQAVQTASAGETGNAVNTVMGAVSSVVGGVFGLVTILILSFYLLVEGRALFEYVTRFVPDASRTRFTTVARESVDKVSAWLRAQFILACVMAAFAGIGLGVLGVPYYYVVALLAAVGETIPILGPIVAGVTAVAIASTASTTLSITVGAYFFMLHQFEANIRCRIAEQSIGVSRSR